MAERGKDRMAKSFNKRASASVGVPYLSILTSPALTLPSLAVSSSTGSCSTLHREEETPTPRRGGAGISSVCGALGGDAWRSTQDYWTCFKAWPAIKPAASCRVRRGGGLHMIPVFGNPPAIAAAEDGGVAVHLERLLIVFGLARLDREMTWTRTSPRSRPGCGCGPRA